MQFPLYHMVPSDLQGEELHSLSTLKDAHPDLYAKYLQKYANRMEVMETRIPILDCKWNDAIHLLPIHPKYIHELFAEVGMPFAKTYFVIDAATLDQDKLAVWLNTTDTRALDSAPDQFEHFNPDHYESMYSVFPKERQMKTIQMQIAEGRPPLMYSRCPHVLYKGSISMSGLSKIRVTKEGTIEEEI